MRSGASGELTELARRRMTSAVLRLVAYVITPVSEVQRLGRVDQPARTRTRDADVQVGEVLEHVLWLAELGQHRRPPDAGLEQGRSHGRGHLDGCCVTGALAWSFCAVARRSGPESAC